MKKLNTDGDISVFSFAHGHEWPKVYTLAELACKSDNDLEHVINRLLRDGSEAAEEIAELLFELYA